MNFTVSSRNLSLGLQRVVNAVSSKPILPILSNILLEAADNVLSITATDGEIRIRTQLPAMTFEPGRLTVQAKKFDDIARSLPVGDVCFVTNPDDPEEIRLSCNKTQYNFRGLSAEQFPEEAEFEEEWGIDMQAQELISSLAKVAYARSDDENRKVLNGVLLSVRSGLLTIAATDGRRLALVEKPLPSEENVPDGDVILPVKAVDELRKGLDKEDRVKIRLTSSSAVFETGSTVIMTKLTDGVYPNYRQVIPASFSQKVAIPRVIFSDVLNRVSKVNSENSSSVRFSITANEMEISAKSAEYGEAREPIEVSLEGEDTEISFNPEYIVDPLKTLECDQLILQFNDGFSPCALQGDEGFLYILMPMH